jgi:adenylate cyclase class 2
VADNNLETELKIPVSDLDPIRVSLQRARAVVVMPMTRETNLLLDTGDGRLREGGCLLRLRQHGDRKVLTFKGPATYRGPIKERPEHETQVADLDRTSEIFGELGYSVFMRYEKDREEWLLEEYSVVLDRTPMGDFVEIEGPADGLERIADLLGIKITAAVQGSYVRLWLEHRARHPELDLPYDMVFAR